MLVSRDLNAEAIIWNRENERAVWKSKPLDSDSNNAFSDETAEDLIRSCGQNAPHLWPHSFPSYTSAAFFENHTLYSNVLGEKTLLGNFPSYVLDWTYDKKCSICAAGLSAGHVAICKVIGSP